LIDFTDYSSNTSEDTFEKTEVATKSKTNLIPA